MKEAAGEANLTVVAIILIAVVVAVATPLINSLMKTSAKKSCCTDAGGVWKGGKCQAANGDMDHYSSSAYDTCVKDATNGSSSTAS